MTAYVNGNEVKTVNGNSLSCSYIVSKAGEYSIWVVGTSSTGTTDSATQGITVKDKLNTELHVANFNQKYTENDQCIKNGGCVVCCVADISSYYSGEEISLSKLKRDEVYSNNSAYCQWTKIKYFSLKDVEDNLYSTVKSEIDKGCPVLLHYGSIHSPADGHWVVAYKYINECETDEDIYVCDPAFTYDELYGVKRVYYSGQNPFWNNVYNHGFTIKAAKAANSITDLIEIKTTSPV